MGYDVTWMAKIKSHELREVSMFSLDLEFLGKNRILMDKTKKMLCKKFQ
jgi:hypothetical protein